MSSPPNAEEAATAAPEPVGSPTPAAPAANTPGQSRIGKAPKVKPLKLGYLSFKEGNMLKKTFKPRFCILNKNNELEAYRDPNVRSILPALVPHASAHRTKPRALSTRYYPTSTFAMSWTSRTTRTMASSSLCASTRLFTSCAPTPSRCVRHIHSSISLRARSRCPCSLAMPPFPSIVLILCAN